MQKDEKTTLAPSEDAISRQDALDCLTATGLKKFDFILDARDKIKNLPSVTPSPKIGHCKDCKHWKDSDGTYRRDIHAESKCPMNRIEVYEGTGYCFLFESKAESEEKDDVEWLPQYEGKWVSESDVKLGCWIKEIMPIPLSDTGKECVRCSECNTHYDFVSVYCPSCGAKMES